MGTRHLVALALLGIATASFAAGKDDVKARLQSPALQGLYARTYKSLLDRTEASGYMQESMTGAYAGMFPRTVGGLVSLYLETGEYAKSEALTSYVLRAMQANKMERVPHVIGAPYKGREPLPGPGSVVQAGHPIALYRVDQPARFGGAQEFIAPAEAIRAIELWLTGDRCKGTLTLDIAPTLDAPAIAEAKVDAASLSGGWTRFAFAPPLRLPAGKQYVMRLHHEGTGTPAWWGVDLAPEALRKQFGEGHGRDAQIQPGWMLTQKHVTAYALDTGRLQHSERETIPLYAAEDQIDGQAHVIMSWARLALRRGPTPFETRTYTDVAKLMDRTSDWPYLTPYYPNSPLFTVATGLVRNVCFEHSRDGRFWDTFDILTQSFVCAALTDMTRVAESRHDAVRAARWRNRLNALQAAIRARMTRELDGQTVYLEMRLPDGGGGVPFGGLGWVNLAPVAAQWEGVDRDILASTVAAYRKRALFTAGGLTAIATDWWPDRPLDKTVIGKGVGWEMVYSLDHGEWDRICQWLDFVAAVNTQPIYMESCGLGADGKWYVGDPGNGEQCSWWCWGMARVRKAVGLTPAP